MTTWPVFYSSHERGAAFVVGAVATTARTIAATTHRADVTYGAPTAGARGWACSRNGARSEEATCILPLGRQQAQLTTLRPPHTDGFFQTCINEKMRTRQPKEEKKKQITPLECIDGVHRSSSAVVSNRFVYTRNGSVAPSNF